MTFSHHQVIVILILVLAISSIGSAFVSGEELSSRIAIYQDGSWYIDSDGNGVFGAGDRNAGFGASLYVPVSGDWNGDNITEIGAYRDGAWYLDYDDSGDWSAGDRNYGYGALNWTPVVGDWNGDGADKIGAYKDGAWYLDTNGNGTFDTGDKNYAFGGAGWEPVIGKWTADGKSKIGVYKDGVYYIDYNGNGTYDGGDKTIVYGTAGSIAITGDWNANSLTEIGTKNGSAWNLDYDGLGGINASTKSYTFGSAGWTPVTGDWNADGADKIGIYLNGAWYLDANGNGVWDAGTDKNYAFGSTGWTPVIGKWSERAAGPAPVANFTGTPRAGMVPLTVSFTDTSTGSPDIWNWSFGDGNYSELQNPSHTYEIAGDYNVSLVVTKGTQSGNITKEEYIYAEAPGATFDASLVLNSIPPTMFQGEHYLVDVKMNNTGSKKWFADPTSPNHISLKGLGGPSGDAAKFNITNITMIFDNESASPGQSYDFFFYVKAPDTIGTYTPQYQVNSTSSGTFGEVASATVNVIENPFHPVTQPNGTKLYTTPFGNADSGISVDIVGPRVYLDDIHAASVDDPRFLINPSLKSSVYDLELNDTFSYADVTIPYDPAKVTYTANLSIGYFNATSGNYTFVASTVDTANHTVTARVSGSGILSHGASFAALDRLKYQALPGQAQTEMGYLDLGPVDNSTVQFYDYAPVCQEFYFFSRLPLPPGNYTILTSGQYNNVLYLPLYPDWYNYAGTLSADNDYKQNLNTGMMVHFQSPPGGSGSVNVSRIRISSGVLKLSHTGGPISMSNYAPSNQYAGSTAKYKLYYGDGPAFSEDYNTTELENNEFNATEKGYDVAVTAYQAAAGCVLGQAGQKGGYLDSVHSAIPGWNDAINDDVTESTAYMVGHVACAIAFPEIALARDFCADVARGDPIAAALDSLGYLGAVKNLLKSSGVISAFVVKNPGSDVKLINGLNSLKMAEGVTYVDKFSWYDEASGGVATWLSARYGTSTESMERIYTKAYKPLGKIKTFLESSPTTVWADKNGKSGAIRLVNDYEKHVKLQNEWGYDIGVTLYRQKAINLLSRRDSGVELYYQKGYDELAVYDRANNEFVTGTINGDIVTFFKPRGDYIANYILDGALIRLN